MQRWDPHKQNKWQARHDQAGVCGVSSRKKKVRRWKPYRLTVVLGNCKKVSKRLGKKKLRWAWVCQINTNTDLKNEQTVGTYQEWKVVSDDEGSTAWLSVSESKWGGDVRGAGDERGSRK